VSTGTWRSRSGVANQRKAFAACSGGVLTRKRDVSCRTEKAVEATVTPREMLKREIVKNRNFNITYLQRKRVIAAARVCPMRFIFPNQHQIEPAGRALAMAM